MHSSNISEKMYKKKETIVSIYNTINNIYYKPRRGQKIDRDKNRLVKRQRQNYFQEVE